MIWPGPLVVPITGSIKLLTDAKQRVKLVQLTPSSSPVVAGTWVALQCAPPSVVLVTVALTPTA